MSNNIMHHTFSDQGTCGNVAVTMVVGILPKNGSGPILGADSLALKCVCVGADSLDCESGWSVGRLQ